jgi:prolyl-tRNA synthetase
MRYSNFFCPTLKEKPAEAEVISHQLMMRAGMIRKLAAGIYAFLPMGLRVLRKVEAIIREEMNRAGAQECLLPALQPADLWRESGRWELYGKELLRLIDRHNHDFCLGPTHEEVITDLVRNEVRSYRELPLNLYQIQTKFRDEIRPRFGLMRGREFGMMDAYSFDRDQQGVEQSYREMYQAYERIFARCGVRFKAVEADTGPIGGSFSHEFMVLADTGEDLIASCTACDYAANIEKAELLAPPPEARPDPAAWLPLTPVETPAKRTVEEVTAYLKIPAQNLVKTLIYTTDAGPLAVLVRGDHEVNEVKLKKAAGTESLGLAPDALVQEITGAPAGFAGPKGLNQRILADWSVFPMLNFTVGGNQKDQHLLKVNWDRDFKVEAFLDLRFARSGDLCPRCRGTLEFKRGIEVGHVFILGDKYSKALKATYLDDQGKECFMIMGCYGIGTGRTAAAAIEQNHDANGIIFPLPIAPFQVELLVISARNEKQMAIALSLYEELQAAGLEVFFDDRDERPGVKFKDADLLGIPFRVTIGNQAVQEGMVELKERQSTEVSLIPIREIAQQLTKI